MTTASMRSPHPITGRHVLLALIAFFGVMLAVNLFFVYCALSTFDGMAASDPYRSGLAYNRTIEEAAEQDALGWQTALALATGASGSTSLDLSITSSTGAPVDGLIVAGTFGRPASAREDRSIMFAEAGPGRYLAKLGAVPPGTWVASLEAKRSTSDGTSLYRLKQRLWVKP